MTSFAVEIGAKTARDLDALVAEYRQTGDQLVAEAVERFVREEMDFVLAIREGEADIAAGRVHSHEEVVAMFTAGREARDAA